MDLWSLIFPEQDGGRKIRPRFSKALGVSVCGVCHHLCLRNRFLLTVICCRIYHWLEVSQARVIYLLKNWLLIVFVSLSYKWKKKKKKTILKCTGQWFHSYLIETKISTFNSCNLIACDFHAKLKGKQLWNKTKF